MLRNLLLVAAVIGLGYVAFSLMAGKDSPRAKLKTPEQTLLAYTEFVTPFVGPSAARPSVVTLSEFLSYFDSDSASWFDKNHANLVRGRYQFDEAGYKALKPDELRVQAMVLLINRPPLSGFGAIQEVRINPDGMGANLVVLARGMNRATIEMTRRGDLWYISKWGGLQTQLDQESARWSQASQN